MSIAKVKTSNAVEGRKSEDGNDSLNTFIRQAIAKEPFISFPRSADGTIQWMQFLHSIDPDSPSWPGLPVKVPMQKCDKCNKEFFSPINCRRHVRVHHRLKKLHKDTVKNRDLLRVFWDKLSVDEAKEIVALKNCTLEDLPGATVIKALASLIRKPGIPSVPHFCIKAGSALLDIVQARPSRFPLSSLELFSILDDASEKTFLSGSAISMQKYIFDGEAAKIGLDTKNLVAFTSFLLEQKLVEAWIADKDAEAMRYQKLLVEEEDAARKRQAEILERKRQKKLRQKEQKAKEQRGEEVGINDSFEVEEAQPPTEASINHNESDLQGLNLGPAFDDSFLEVPEILDEEEADCKVQAEIGYGEKDSNTCPNVEPQRSIHRPFGAATWHLPQKLSVVSNGSRGSSSMKPEFWHRHGIRDLKVAHTVNNKKIWSRKPKPEKDGENLKIGAQEALIQAGQDSKQEVLIGSISVTLGSSQGWEESDSAGALACDCSQECQPQKSDEHGKTSKLDTIHSSTNHSTVKFWRRRHEVKGPVPVEDGNGEAEVDADGLGEKSQVLSSSENCLGSSCADYHDRRIDENILPKEGDRLGSPHFSSEAARAFLSQRWKEAIASDHIRLVLAPEPGASSESVDLLDTPDSGERSILGNAENRLGNGPMLSGIARTTDFKSKPEKGFKKKYIPKQRLGT